MYRFLFFRHFFPNGRHCTNFTYVFLAGFKPFEVLVIFDDKESTSNKGAGFILAYNQEDCHE